MAQKKAAPLIPAVIYARYSSSGQREESIEGQLRECHDFARRNGLTVVGEYVDKALTGRSDKRPDFQRMLRDCERGVFQAVICWKMDRFARNRYDSAMYKYKLKRNGVRIFYAKESIPEGPEGIILESVMEGYAEYYSENLSQNVKRGYYDSALELKTLGQTVLGLRKGPDGRFEIDPATAPIVRRIFEEYAAGERAKDIYTRLNDEGYRTSRGGLFNKNSLRRILQNEKYVGVYEFRDIRVENGIPAIVDRELFDRCQGMVEKHHRAPAADRATSFLLTAKLFCGHCGEPMTGDGGTGRSGRVYNYYTCNGRRVHKCQKERAPKEWIEQLVVDELVDLIHSDDFVNEVADRCMEFQQREKDQSALRALEARQKENEKAIQNMLAAIEAGIITPSTKSRLMELEAERGQIEKGIAQQLIAEPTLERDQVVYFLERFRDGDVSDEGYRAFLVDTFLNSVYLYDDDKLVLVLNYTGERCKVTLDLVESAVEGDGLGGSCFAPSSAVNGAKQNTGGSCFASFWVLEKTGGVIFSDHKPEKCIMNFYFSLLTPEHKKLPLYIAGIGHDKPQRHVCRDKEFPYYQFAYCTAGKGIFRIDGKEYTIEEGMMFCFEPGIPHEYYMLTEDFSTRWIIFMGADMDVIMDNVNIERRYDVVYLYNPSEFLHCLDMIERLVERNASDSMFRASGLFYQYITNIRHVKDDCRNKGVMYKVNKAVDYIQNNYMRNISLEDIADDVMVSESYLCRIFRDVYNMGPMLYLTYHRINEAKKMLIEKPSYSICDISLKVGFQSASYFGMVFKRYEGCTPKQFRNSIR